MAWRRRTAFRFDSFLIKRALRNFYKYIFSVKNMNALEEKFKGYRFKVEIPDKEKFDPSVAAVEVMLTTKDGKRYSANIVTKDYIPWVFEKNRRTGECANGTCWGRKDNMIFVRKITPEEIRTSIDYFIKNFEIESYLTEIV